MTTNYIQALPTEHGLSVLTSELKDTAKNYVLVGAPTPNATAAELKDFHSAEIASSFFDENRVLTFVITLPIELATENYVYQVKIVDEQNQAVVLVDTPIFAMAKGIGGTLTVKVPIMGEAGDIVFKSSEFITEPEMESIWLPPIYEKFAEHVNTEDPHEQYLTENDLTSLFPMSKNINGWTQLPNGLILQWGTKEFLGPVGNASDLVKTNVTANLTIAFPNEILQAVGIGFGYDGCELSVGLKDIDINSLNFLATRVSGSSAGKEIASLNWLAIGY